MYIVCAGLTNPPSIPTLREIPYPIPDPEDAYYTAAYEISWDPPVFMGGRTHLQYNITVDTVYDDLDNVASANTISLVMYLEDGLRVWVHVTVIESVDSISSQQLSDHGPQLHEVLESDCVGQGNMPLETCSIGKAATNYL